MQSCADGIVENKVTKQDDDENPSDLYGNAVKDAKKGNDDPEIEDIHCSTYDKTLGDWIIKYAQLDQPHGKEFNLWPALRNICEHYTDSSTQSDGKDIVLTPEDWDSQIKGSITDAPVIEDDAVQKLIDHLYLTKTPHIAHNVTEKQYYKKIGPWIVEFCNENDPVSFTKRFVC